MNEETKIIDESGDKKYYTQIPNMIVNHSTSEEQSLYLVMKRLAGEHGSCFASLNFLSEKMGKHKTTVSKTIKKLLRRKWIKEIEKKRVRGGVVRQFVIIDLWKLNIQEYESGAGMTTKESGAVVDGSGAVVDGSGAQSDTKKNYKKNYKEELHSRRNTSEYGKPEITKILNTLKEKFSLTKLDGSEKENRRYANLAIKKFGDDLPAIIEAAAKDEFWKNKVSSVKDIYYNGVKILQLKKGRIKAIDLSGMM